ncbi:MAG: 30S ribosomal protein S6 [Dehalococcoidales bacterium]|nr:30S ribosomal protein S6 [Dehalococcoidales bacterium]
MVSKETLKIEDVRFRDYELTLIISPEVTEEKFDATVDSIIQFITEKGGTVSDIERWGKRKLAYPIEHFAEGSYVLARFKLGPEFGNELETNLQISEEVLRYLLIRVNS